MQFTTPLLSDVTVHLIGGPREWSGLRTSTLGRSYPLTKGLTGLNRTSASSSKADVRNVRVGTGLYGCFWPKADIQTEMI